MSARTSPSAVLAAAGLVSPAIASAAFGPPTAIFFPLGLFIALAILAPTCVLWRARVVVRVNAFLLGVVTAAASTCLAFRSIQSPAPGALGWLLLGVAPPLATSLVFLTWAGCDEGRST